MENETLKDEPTPNVAFGPKIFSGLILDNHWKILESLNAGGMGEVYKARDLRFERDVVVKVLKKESLANPWKLKKFGHEGRGQGRIQHPNVATVFDKGVLPTGEQYLVMEFIDGSTLGDLIKIHKENNDQIDFLLVAEIMQQVGRGVAAIHRAGLIHRDLKPENIMIQDNDDGLTAKIIDFGIVRILDTSTVWGQIVGTLLYMSPEQLQGNDAEFTSDIYSLGVIAYELVTGQRPFEPTNPAHLHQLQKNGVKRKPSSLRDELPQRAESIILKALSYKPNKRQPQVLEFTDELAQVLAEPKSAPTKRRLTKVQFVVVTLLVAILATIGWGFWSFMKSKGTTTELDAGARADSGPVRTLTYSLSILRKRDRKTTLATGRETFDTGDEFRLRFTSSQPGALYLFNEGLSGSWHVLFPTRKNRQGNPQLGALQTIETDGYEFTNQSGFEKGKERIWIVWATGPVSLLDDVVKQAMNTDLIVKDSAQQRALYEFLSKLRSTPPDVSVDESRAEVTIKMRADIFAYVMELETKDWK